MSPSQNLRTSFLFFALYFFEGAPMGLIWWTIPTLLSLQGFTVETITTLGATATLPWTCKFLLGPVVDRFIYTSKQHAWTIACLQLGIGLGVFSLILVPLSNPLILYCLLLMSFFSAIQDVVIDAWAIASVDAHTRGRINGSMQVGMLSGRWLFGAGLLIGLAYISLNVALTVLLTLILASILFLFFWFKNKTGTITTPQLNLSLKSFSFLTERKFVTLALVALTTGFALESFTSVISPFLVNFGMDQHAVGMVLSATLICMLLGAVTGGLVSDFWGDLKTFALATLTVALFVSVMGFYKSFSFYVFVTAVLTTYFSVGFFTSSSYTYFMNQSQGQMEASKFTFLMAITNLCEVLAAFSMGRMFTLFAEYYIGFLVCMTISLAGVVILLRFHRRQNTAS
jgi:MFS family permease